MNSTGTGPRRGMLHVVGTLAVLLMATIARADVLSPGVLDALEAARMGRATDLQMAMLFAQNDAINRARLNGFISDAHYQAAQHEFAILNEGFAREAAADVGAEFTVQTRRSTTFSPGTDSDYILRVDSPDPVGQVREAQTRYNQRVNEYLEKVGAEHGIKIRGNRNDWHRQLDVDFMADPRYVSDDQFRQIADLNNDAYHSRRAAEFERLSRTPGAGPIDPLEFQEYTNEMNDFIKKKGDRLRAFRQNPGLMASESGRAEYHRLMAQQQKYIERIESANLTLRRQEGLSIARATEREAYYELSYTANGEARLIHRSPESIAARGARRGPSGFRTTAAADALAENSTRRAVRDLAESMGEAAAKNPGRWKNAAAQIADLAADLPPAEKGRLIEHLRLRGGDGLARGVAEHMRGGKSAGGGMVSALRISEDVEEMGRLRRGYRQAAGKVRSGLSKIGGLEGAVEIAFAANDMRHYVNSIEKAMDTSITDEEADEYFREAHEAAKSMAMGGAMGALFTKVPAAGALYMSWTVSYEGAQYVLTNTETGQRLNRHVFEYFDRNMLAYEDAVEDLTERLGGESTRMAREDQLRELEARYAQAIRDGRIRLREGVTGADVLERIRAGELWTLDELLVSAAEAENPDKGLGTLYMAWLVDASTEVSGKMIWIHAGSVEDFRKLTKFRDVLWGGKSDKLAQKTELFGGETFESFDEVVELLRAQIGSSIVRKRAPLAFPKTYYMAGEYHVGFEIINHDSLAAIKQAADDRPVWADASNDSVSSGDERAPPPGDPGGSRDPDAPGFICASDPGGDDHSGWKPMHDGDLPPDVLAGPTPWDNPEVRRRIDEWLSRSAPKMPPSPLGRDTRRWLWSEWGQPYCPPSVVLTGKPDAGGKSRYQYLFELAERLESERYGTLRHYIETGEVAPETAGGSPSDRGLIGGDGDAVSESAPPPMGSDEGMAAPQFEARTVFGQPWSLEDMRGKMTILVTFDALSPQRGIDVRRLSELAPAAHVEFFDVLWSEPKWFPSGVSQERVVDPQDGAFVEAYHPAEKLSIWIINESGVVVFRGDLDQGPSPWSEWMDALTAAAPELEWNRMLAEYGRN